LAPDKFHPILLPTKPRYGRCLRAKYYMRRGNIRVWEGKYPTARLLLWGCLLPEYTHYHKVVHCWLR